MDIDAKNIMMGKGRERYMHTTEAIFANTQTNDVVKVLNPVGFNKFIKLLILMEQFACFWINLAMFQGQGQEITESVLDNTTTMKKTTNNFDKWKQT
jgi:8-hydroxy-5-deazaflavin:NADPH oxidoreductase